MYIFIEYGHEAKPSPAEIIIAMVIVVRAQKYIIRILVVHARNGNYSFRGARHKL